MATCFLKGECVAPHPVEKTGPRPFTLRRQPSLPLGAVGINGHARQPRDPSSPSPLPPSAASVFALIPSRQTFAAVKTHLALLVVQDVIADAPAVELIVRHLQDGFKVDAPLVAVAPALRRRLAVAHVLRVPVCLRLR
eukprot:7570258-Pyramimonas_sp.AAC.1